LRTAKFGSAHSKRLATSNPDDYGGRRTNGVGNARAAPTRWGDAVTPGGPAPTLYSVVADRRAPRSAPV